MAKITKREFINAHKLIQKYNAQLLEGQYQFLYFEDFDLDFNEKWIKAKNIDDACAQFIEYTNINERITMVDYEVKFNDQCLDISEREEFSNYF